MKSISARIVSSAVILTLCLLTVFLSSSGKFARATPSVTPMPLISRNVPAFSNDDCDGTYPASLANDTSYDTNWESCGTPSVSQPKWLAYDLSSVPVAQRATVLLVWYNTATGNYDHTLNANPAYNSIKNYTVETDTAAGGGNPPSTGWTTAITITNNTLHSRQHVFNLAGANWIRLKVTAPDGSPPDNDVVMLNMDVYNASQGTADDWIFYGASIFEGAMNQNSLGGVAAFQQLINQSAPTYYPAAEGGGIGGFDTNDALTNLPRWLPLFPGKYVALGYGTNDALECENPTTFYNHYVTLTQEIISAGKVPLVQKILWGPNSSIQACAPALNAQINLLLQNYPQIIPGPDTWTYFQSHPNLIDSDGIHPTDDGSGALRQLWATVALSSVYMH